MRTKEEINAYNVYYRTRFPLKSMWFRARDRAKAKGFEFDISLEELEALAASTTHCPIFGCELQYTVYTGTGRGVTNPCKASLDRKDSSKGYTLDNVWFISWKANNMKNEHTAKDLLTLATALLREGIA